MELKLMPRSIQLVVIHNAYCPHKQGILHRKWKETKQQLVSFPAWLLPSFSPFPERHPAHGQSSTNNATTTFILAKVNAIHLIPMHAGRVYFP